MARLTISTGMLESMLAISEILRGAAGLPYPQGRAEPLSHRGTPAVHRRPSALPVALLVFVGYYAGAKLGFAFTYQPNPISILWLPNSILFAALLLTPFRAWWVVLVAAFPAHLLSELQSGVPPAMVFCWYVSNATEGVIGAGLVRALADRSVLFSTTRNAVLFIAVAIVAPFAASFLDSAFVTSIGWGSADYWQLWRTRFLANAVAALTIVPLIVTWVEGGVAEIRAATRRCAIEAGVLVVGLLVIAVAVFASRIGTDGPLVLLYLPLPFLLWSAVRFGAMGASLCFALVAFVVIWGAGHGAGPLSTHTPAENAFSVQLLLLFVGPLLLCLAALSEERERARQRMRSSEQRFARAFRSSPTAVSIARQVDGCLIEVNEQWEALFGFPRSEAIGRTVDELSLHVRVEARDEIRRLVTAQGCARNLETEMRTRYGEVRQVVIAIETVEMEGEPCFITNVVDVTERRHTEELNQRLAHASRLTAMGELTASIAHEINQPMSAILSNVDAAEMLLENGDVSGDELRRILNDIRNDDLRASEVIRHVRGLANKREIEVERFDLDELVAASLRLIAPIAQRRRVALRAVYAGLPVFRGDRIYIQQVLLNLMFNAMDAMREVSEGARALTVTTSSRTGCVEVAVRDCGHGVAPSQLDRIFESFFTTKKEGMGLGLAIARSLVQAHGGRIWAENNGDAGATFRFTLPVREGSPSCDPR